MFGIKKKKSTRVSLPIELDSVKEGERLKLAEEEAEKARAEVLALKARIAGVEAAIAAWEEDPDGVFAALKPGQKLRFNNDKMKYMEHLEKELGELRMLLNGAQSELQGDNSVVSALASRKKEFWMVEGATKQISGIRASLYDIASQVNAYTPIEQDTNEELYREDYNLYNEPFAVLQLNHLY